MITNADIVKDLRHWRVGNGYAFVSWHEDNRYCRVANYLSDEFPKRVYLAAISGLTPTIIENKEVMLEPAVLEKINELRSDLESGKKVLKDTHVMLAVPEQLKLI
jgi:hypothetical protein